MPKDELFAGQSNTIGDFNFDEETATVFDDMLERSIPQYRELQRMIGEIARDFAQEGSEIYDLGCSTGLTLRTLSDAVERTVVIVGVDYSEAMLTRARAAFRQELQSSRMRFVHADLNEGVSIANASVVVLNLTLQFVRPLRRDALMQSICQGLNENGCLILVEKVLGNDSLFNRTFISYYYDLKRRHGYSEMEIAKKREALENVLVPYRVDENIELLQRNGLQHVDIFFKWYNFCGFLGVKAP